VWLYNSKFILNFIHNGNRNVKPHLSSLRLWSLHVGLSSNHKW
jgi:hypothetical protein